VGKKPRGEKGRKRITPVSGIATAFLRENPRGTKCKKERGYPPPQKPKKEGLNPLKTFPQSQKPKTWGSQVK